MPGYTAAVAYVLSFFQLAEVTGFHKIRKKRDFSMPKKKHGLPMADETSDATTVRPRWWLLILSVAAGVVGICVFALAREPSPRVLKIKVVNRFPHDPTAYCQGLVFHDGALLESTGKNGESTLRQVELSTGRILKKVTLDRRYFGEGITVFDKKIFQLTWKSQKAFVYDLDSFSYLKTHRLSGQGWGLTNDGENLIVSDGTPTLKFIDPESFQVVKKISVSSRGRLIKNINELEFIDGEIWANVWFEDIILRISPKNGSVNSVVNLKGLWPSRLRPDRDAVLNGIAFDAETRRLFVTGKNWPRLFEIKVLE